MHWASKRYILVAFSTDEHHLALTGYHHALPLGLFTARVCFADVFQCVDMVALNGSVSTVLAFTYQEALYEFTITPPLFRRLVV